MGDRGTAPKGNYMSVNNWPKFVGILVINILVFFLVLASKSTWEQGAVIFVGSFSYLVGNGVAAKRDEPVQPVLTKKETSDSNH